MLPSLTCYLSMRVGARVRRRCKGTESACIALCFEGGAVRLTGGAGQAGKVDGNGQVHASILRVAPLLQCVEDLVLVFTCSPSQR